jgi:myo-inositol-1(or 4)-monophosphatase
VQAIDDHAHALAVDVSERRALLDVAVAAAEAAASIVRHRASDARSIPWEIKSHSDFVSEVDMAAERAIRDVIHARMPDAEVIGEELSPSAVARGVTFIADPLDGTTNFLHGFPVYAVSIAVATDGVLDAGAIIDVPHGDRYTAVRGGGAWRNDERISVSPIDDPAKALIGTGFPFKHLAHLDAYQRQFAAVVRATSGIRRAGAAALDLVSVASGAFEGFWELSLAPWDMAAGILLIREAGGVVSDLEGNDVSGLEHGGIVAGSPAIHPWLLAIVQSS